MKIAYLKKMNNLIPGSVKKIFSPVIRKKLINNQVFIEQIKELEDFSSMSDSEIRVKQLELLKDTLIHAYENTIYYKNLFDKILFNPYKFSDFAELEKIPLISKDEIIQNFNDLQASDENDYYFATTGGSTGKPLKIHLDRKSIYKERAFVYSFWSKHGYDYRFSKVASFRGTDFNNKIFKVNPLYMEIQMNPCAINNQTITEYVKVMDKFGVQFLHGFPSAIYSFCKYSESSGINLKNKYQAVFFISENVYDFQKEYVEKVLNCKSYAFYGHSERAVFAEEYDEGYLFNPLYGYVEFNQSNEIICTGFINRRMPLIRYKLDDTAIKKTNGFYQIIGHRDGFLYGKNNEIVSAAMLEVHSTLLDKIANYQFYQNEKGKVIVYIKPLNTITNDEIEKIKTLFQEKIGNSMVVDIQIKNDLYFSNRGKFKLILNEVKD